MPQIKFKTWIQHLISLPSSVQLVLLFLSIVAVCLVLVESEMFKSGHLWPLLRSFWPTLALSITYLALSVVLVAVSVVRGLRLANAISCHAFQARFTPLFYWTTDFMVLFAFQKIGVSLIAPL